MSGGGAAGRGRGGQRQRERGDGRTVETLGDKGETNVSL